jgi:VWFA-related protein
MPIRARSSLVPVIALCATAWPSASKPLPQEPQPVPTFRGEINAVRVDIVVTGEDSRPVTDLGEADFEVLEDGVTQTIDEFSIVRLGNTPPNGPAPQPLRTRLDEELFAAEENVGLFLLYFQHAYFLEGDRGRSRNRESALEVLRRHRALLLEPLIRFVQSLDPADMVAVADPAIPVSTAVFTRDRETTLDALRDHFDEQVWERRTRARMNRDWIPPGGSRYEAIEAASLRLASLRDVRQTLIFVGETLGGSRLALDFQELVTLLKRNNTAVSVIDTGGLDVMGGRFITAESLPLYTTESLIAREANLRGITEETGGHAIVNTNELEAGLARVASDGRIYYLLTYTSPAPADGRFHEIRVKVKRPGLRVRARSGYWAFSTSEMRRAMAPKPATDAAVLAALSSIVALPAAQRPIHTWIGTERRGDRTRVTLVWEPSAAAPSERHQPPNRVSIVARTSDPSVIFEGVSPDPRPGATASASPDKGPHRVTFDARPGVVDVQLVIESPDGVIDTETRTIEVPDYTSVQDATISTPKVFRARTEPERRALLADAAAVPSADREFSRSDRVLVRVDAYGPEASPQAALLNRRGDKMHDIAMSASTTGGTHQMDLRLSHLAAGEYVIAIQPAPGTETRTLVPIRIR